MECAPNYAYEPPPSLHLLALPVCRRKGGTRPDICAKSIGQKERRIMRDIGRGVDAGLSRCSVRRGNMGIKTKPATWVNRRWSGIEGTGRRQINRISSEIRCTKYGLDASMRQLQVQGRGSERAGRGLSPETRMFEATVSTLPPLPPTLQHATLWNPIGGKQVDRYVYGMTLVVNNLWSYNCAKQRVPMLFGGSIQKEKQRASSSKQMYKLQAKEMGHDLGRSDVLKQDSAPTRSGQNPFSPT
jgi:hypothetical protein